MPNSALYSDAVNVSLQAALGFGAGAGAGGAGGEGGATGLPPFLSQSMLQHHRERDAAEKHLAHHPMMDR